MKNETKKYIKAFFWHFIRKKQQQQIENPPLFSFLCCFLFLVNKQNNFFLTPFFSFSFQFNEMKTIVQENSYFHFFCFSSRFIFIIASGTLFFLYVSLFLFLVFCWFFVATRNKLL